MANKARNEKVETLEQGNIYFFYRPKVDEEDPESLSDVQRFYMVMSPGQSDKVRLTVIGRKRLPDPGKKTRDWGFVDKVRNFPKFLRDELKGETYKTKTRGERHAPAARALGEGVYRIVRHGDHTHLVYALELPKEPGEPQEETRIEKEASYIITVKNPEKGSPPSTGLPEDKKADYPKHLQEQFGDRTFSDADPPDLLDREGTEFVLIGASDDVEAELGIKLQPRDESEKSADIFKELQLDKSRQPVKPLFEGEWD